MIQSGGGLHGELQKGMLLFFLLLFFFHFFLLFSFFFFFFFFFLSSEEKRVLSYNRPGLIDRILIWNRSYTHNEIRAVLDIVCIRCRGSIVIKGVFLFAKKGDDGSNRV